MTVSTLIHTDNAAPDDALRVLAGLTHCCLGAVEDGPTECTCWEPEYDLEQAAPNSTLTPGTRTEMCVDCACRPDSPERRGDSRYLHSDDPVSTLTQTFWCHQGMRKPLRFRHPLGITVECTGDFYEPPIRDGVPYRADGTPGERCAGWAAYRRADARRANPRTCRVCGCTDARACYPPCWWAEGVGDICSRCAEDALRSGHGAVLQEARS